MRRVLFALLLAIPALAQSPAQRQALDEAFAALRDAPSEEAAAPAEARIMQYWLGAASPAVGLLVRRGLRNTEAGALAEALEDFDAALDLSPDLPEAWHRRGIVLLLMGDTEAAARAVQQALNREPRHFAALTTLSRIAEARGDLRAALAAMEAALAIHPRLQGGTQRRDDLRRRIEGDAT